MLLTSSWNMTAAMEESLQLINLLHKVTRVRLRHTRAGCGGLKEFDVPPTTRGSAHCPSCFHPTLGLALLVRVSF